MGNIYHKTGDTLSTITGDFLGQGAEVLDSDTGTHTDPVVGSAIMLMPSITGDQEMVQ